MSTISIVVIAGYGSGEQFREVESRLASLDTQSYVTATEGFPITLVTSAPIEHDAYEVFTALGDEAIEEEVAVAFSEGASHYELPTPHEVTLGGTTYRLLAEYPGFDEEGTPLF